MALANGKEKYAEISAYPQFSQRLNKQPEAGASRDTADPNKGQRI
jgi:hypothetical protein